MKRVNFKEITINESNQTSFDRREFCLAVLLMPKEGATPKEMRVTYHPLIEKIENGDREMLLEESEYELLLDQLDRKYPKVSKEIFEMIDDLENAEEFDPNSKQ